MSVVKCQQMTEKKRSNSRSRHAILGVLAFEPSTGYEIKKLLTETTAHFWKESYGQIYPMLETLAAEGCIEVAERKTDGRESIRYRILPPGIEELKGWIRSPQFQMRPGRHELLLKLFFARREDAASLISQVQEYRAFMNRTASEYGSFGDISETEEIPPDARLLIGTTIDYGVAAASMQIQWCERTLKILMDLEAGKPGPGE